MTLTKLTIAGSRALIDMTAVQLYYAFHSILQGLVMKKKEVKNSKEDKKDLIPLPAFNDPEGQEMWQKNFSKAMIVPLADFIKVLSKAFDKPIADEFLTQLRYVLGNFVNIEILTVVDISNTGQVNVFKFAEFLDGFGPYPNLLDRVRHT
jgi:hypothetical protein